MREIASETTVRQDGTEDPVVGPACAIRLMQAPPAHCRALGGGCGGPLLRHSCYARS